ncbi:zinc-dependent alcohol dehydrogenase [Anoxynatronum sibiricum]|uniref:Alcohol dehydrogenase catalytic domain-containing protein n=1 Tax=Anoxynatronum sibiricum TaxID=210623 RepID=A0ABU9VRB5_9CLOT
MQAIIYRGPEKLEVVEQPKPAAPKGAVLIKISHSGICGTDLNIYAGAHPRAQAPLIMGHEFSGVVAEDSANYKAGTPVTVYPLVSCGQCEPCKTGQSHVCTTLKLLGIDFDGGMASYAVVSEELIIPLKEEVPLKLGAFIEPVAVAVHALRKGNYQLGDGGVVFGAGTIGLCVALTLRHYGASQVVVVETNPFRLKMAAEMGFETINPLDVSVEEALFEKSGGTGFDLAFDCAGHPSVSEKLTHVVKSCGQIVMVAAYKKPAPLDLIQGMFKEISMQFVRVYTKKDFEIAAEMIVNVPEFERIITHELPAAEAQQGFDLLVGQKNAVKVMFTF